jgi:maleylpyruvate isomerase
MSSVDRRDTGMTRDWVRTGTEFFLSTLDALPPAVLDAPSRLPDWRRRHVVAHVARNAESLSRLASWARTGVETPAYASAQARAADIERTAQADPDSLRHDVWDTATALEHDFDALSGAQWANEVQTRGGRTVPAAELPWMRVREVWIHTVDLDAGPRFEDIPAVICTALVDDVTGGFAERVEGVPGLRLTASDVGGTWTIGDGGTAVTAPVTDLAAWLTGRATRPEASLPRWL